MCRLCGQRLETVIHATYECLLSSELWWRQRVIFGHEGIGDLLDAGVVVYEYKNVSDIWAVMFTQLRKVDMPKQQCYRRMMKIKWTEKVSNNKVLEWIQGEM